MSADDSVKITRYLLHEMDEREREEIESRYFSDPDYLALLEAVEGDLIDAYVRGELSRGQHARFEEFFLRTRSRRERLRAAEALQAKLRREENGMGRRVKFAIAAMLVLLIGAGVFFATRNAQPGGAPAASAAGQRRPGAGPAPQPLPPVTLAATLMPGLTRAASAPQKIVLRPDVDDVHIHALVDVNGDWPDLRARLGDWSAADLTMNADRTVTIAIPAAQLTPGEHVLVLTSGDEPLGDYAFVVEKKF